jgi:hypothetical protein
MENKIILRLLEYEENPPEKGDYLNFHAKVISQMFSGSTEFWIARNDLEGFLYDLAEFDSKLDGETVLTCGWGDKIYFKIRFFAYDKLGHIRISIELGRPAFDDEMHELKTVIQIEPSIIRPFILDVRAVLNKQQNAEISIQGL